MEHLRWRCMVNHCFHGMSYSGKDFTNCNTLLENGPPRIFLFCVQALKLITDLQEVWDIMIYAVLAAWSTTSCPGGQTAGTGSSGCIGMRFHNCDFNQSRRPLHKSQIHLSPKIKIGMHMLRVNVLFHVTRCLIFWRTPAA